jgi:hypothetical protein
MKKLHTIFENGDISGYDELNHQYCADKFLGGIIDKECIEIAINNGQKDFLIHVSNYFEDVVLLQQLHKYCTFYAYQANNLNLLQYFLNYQSLWDVKFIFYLFEKSNKPVLNNNKECLNFLYFRGYELYYYNEYNSENMNFAIQNNDIEMLENIMNIKPKISKLTLISLIDNDNIEMLCTLLLTYKVPVTICTICTRSLKYLKFFHENGYKLFDTMCCEAIYNNNLECLQYLLDNGCSVTNNSVNVCVNQAIMCDNVEILKYLQSLNCTINSNNLIYAICSNKPLSIAYLYELKIMFDPKIFIKDWININAPIFSDKFQKIINAYPTLKDNDELITKLIKLDYNDLLRQIFSKTLPKKYMHLINEFNASRCKKQYGTWSIW